MVAISALVSPHGRVPLTLKGRGGRCLLLVRQGLRLVADACRSYLARCSVLKEQGFLWAHSRFRDPPGALVVLCKQPKEGPRHSLSWDCGAPGMTMAHSPGTVNSPGTVFHWSR